MTLRKNADIKDRVDLGDLAVGQTVVANVKKVEVYGMFLRVKDSSISGLCHRSEVSCSSGRTAGIDDQLSDDKNQDVGAALKGFREGDLVRAVIIKLDATTGKVNFSMKASLMGEGAIEADEEEDDDDELRADDDDLEGQVEVDSAGELNGDEVVDGEFDEDESVGVGEDEDEAAEEAEDDDDDEVDSDDQSDLEDEGAGEDEDDAVRLGHSDSDDEMEVSLRVFGCDD